MKYAIKVGAVLHDSKCLSLIQERLDITRDLLTRTLYHP